MMKRAHDLVKVCETTVVDKTSNAKKNICILKNFAYTIK